MGAIPASPATDPVTRLPAARLVVALPAEARPIIRHYGLGRIAGETPYPLYARQQLMLVLSGVGAAASEGATRWLWAQQPSQANPSPWINVGIAGHAQRQLGEAVLAASIEDADKSERWQIDLPPQIPCPSGHLITCSRPQHLYPEDALYDMESAGFLRALAALEGTTPYCLKIISDNRQHTIRQINGKRVAQLVERQLPILERLIRCVT